MLVQKLLDKNIFFYFAPITCIRPRLEDVDSGRRHCLKQSNYRSETKGEAEGDGLMVSCGGRLATEVLASEGWLKAITRTRQGRGR